jgi:hypothetical protein
MVIEEIVEGFVEGFWTSQTEFNCHNISNCIENDCFAEPAPFSPYRQKCSHG